MPTPQDREIRLAFFELGPRDREHLALLRPLLEKHADAFVANFYRHLLSFEGTRSLLAEPEVKDRLLVKQREYLLSLMDPPLDMDYFRQRLAIGATHVRVGLAPRYYLGAYSLYFRLLVPAILEHWQRDLPLAEAIILSLQKVLMLDMSVAMESYIARREERLNFQNQELASASLEAERRWEVEHALSREATARARAAENLASLATIVAGLAHEIGTPMSVIQGHAELLESSVESDRGKRQLRTIREQIERISHIIHTLLNMARPDDRLDAQLDLAQILRDTLAFLGEKLRAHAVEVELDAPGPARVRGNADKLQQVFINLVLNSVDAMPDGGRLSVRLRPAGDDAFEVQLADTGCGMPVETQSRVFEPFFSTKEPGRGSGLGLSVVKGIVSDHGGSISLASAVGRGTEFRLRFPRFAAAADQSDAPVKSGA
ncbi:MAG TPA: protoglobin domain-containing protein [Myxococcota bacterium]|nr:protoglobin domain-containing protein [Myxococcota bacterium]